MSAIQLAQRYGQALWDLAARQEQCPRVVEDLQALVALQDRAPELKACLDNPTIPVRAKQAVLDALAGSVLHPLSRNFVSLLIRSRRGALLPVISQVLEAKRDEAEGQVKVRVESALPLAEAAQADLRRALAQWLRKKIQLQITVAPELLVGLTIQVGDRLIDGSGLGQLRQLRQVLMA